MPTDAVMGITVVAKGGGTYDTGEYDNLQYTTTDGTTFTTTSAPLLTYNEAKAAAYYPYAASTDVTAVPVTTESQTDYMYSGWYEGLTESNPNAQFEMKHALSAVRINVQKDANYTSAATLKAVRATSQAFYASATLDATSTTGTLSGLTGPSATVEQTNLTQTLSPTPVTYEFLVVPGTSAQDITFTATIGDNEYIATASSVTLQQGAIHSFTLTMTPQGLAVTNTTVQQWTTQTYDPLTLEKYDPWKNLANGVYAVSATGNPIAYNDASVDATCLGVALITDNQRIMIEKYEASQTVARKAAYDADGATTTSTNYTYFYWGMYGSYNSSITNYMAASSVSSYGYIPLIDGTYYDSSATQLGAYTTWTGSYALNDWNGKANTAAIQSASDTDSYTTYANMGTYCTKFNATSSENQGYTDWYIPSCGQLALIHTYTGRSSSYGGNVSGGINEMLTKIGGTTFYTSNYYWSSSEYSSGGGWRVYFDRGYVDNDNKGNSRRVRLVRDL